MSQIENVTQEQVDAIWKRPEGPDDRVWPDLDLDGEREARVAYMRRPKVSGYAKCYRCESAAGVFVSLRVSSLTPVCRDHLEPIVYGLVGGDLVEAGRYGES